jgi:EpsI family protein
MLVIPLQDRALQNRMAVLWVALILFLGYFAFLKAIRFFKKTSELVPAEGAIPLWRFQNSRWLAPTLIAFSTLMVSPWLGDNIRSFYPPKHKEVVLRAPLGIQGWQGPQAASNDFWAPVYPNASSTLSAVYFTKSVSSPESVFLYAAYYDSDRSFEEMFDAKNSIYNKILWKKIESQAKKVMLNNDESTVVLEVTLQAGAITRLVWYWYYIAGVSTINLSTANFLDKVRIVSKYAQGSGLISVSTSFAATPDEARQRLERFLKVMYGSLDGLKRPEITYTTLTQAGK